MPKMPGSAKTGAVLISESRVVYAKSRPKGCKGTGFGTYLICACVHIYIYIYIDMCTSVYVYIYI